MTTPPAAFDHLIHWVADLDATTASYDNAGLATYPALTMPGFRNAAWGIDDARYVELATVDDWDAVQTSKYSRGLQVLRPAIDALDGEGPLTFAVNVPDIRATIDRLRAVGHEVIIDEVWFEDRQGGFTEVHVTDVPHVTPFFIAYNPPREVIARMRAEHRAANGVVFDPDRPQLVALLVGSATPEQDAASLASLIGCGVRGTTVDLQDAEIRFDADAPEGLYGITVSRFGDEPTEIAGLTIYPEV
ncbi:VOC family protein [Corynebacterium provencense]|uniref:VOC family protein n=1 Tax=Corynebacterium provencense TaxID=1737425 RepID=UPI00082F65AB|nr:VOC family protein [Corynebacterium provencense]